MTQYEAPLLHNSQDMMQELFEEINGFLGDKDKPELTSHTPPVLSPFNMSTEGEEDEHSIEHSQGDETILVNHGETTYQTQSPLQPAMFVESDEEDSATDNGDARDPIHIEHDQSEQAVCMCYKCKNDKTGCSGQQEGNENTNYDKSFSSSASQFSPFKRRSKPTSSFGGAVGNAKLAHIAGLVKQTLTSTPRDILPSTTATSTQKRPTNIRRHSALSTSSTSDKLNSPFIPLAASSSTTSRHSYQPNEIEDAHTPSLALSYNGTSSSGPSNYGSNNADASFNGDMGYQENRNNYIMMTTEASGDLTTSMNWDTSISQDTRNQSEIGLYNDQVMDNTDHTAAAYLDSFPEEKQQLPDGFPLTQQLPFLTPIHRIGEPHSIVLRTKMARDVGSHEDRINAYNNAYSHCIMARTDMVPWIKKQYSKGPPNLVLQYTPRPKKSSRSLFGLFKRQSRLGDTLPSAPLTANGNPDLSKLSVSSARSSILTESTNAASPQPSFTPSESYFLQQQQQQQPKQHVLQQTNEAAPSLLPAALSSNDEDLCLSPSDIDISTYKPHEQHHRSPSPSRPTSNGKKKSKSFASVAEPVSILKKSSSMANVTDRPGGSILKKSSSAASFVDEELSPRYPNKSPASTFGYAEDDPFASNMMKGRSPSPNPSMESRRPPTRHRSPSPMSCVPMTTNSNNSNDNKRNQLLCPLDNQPPARQRSRSVSPSPRPSPSQRSRSSSPMAPPPPMRLSSLPDEHYEAPHHYRQHPSSDHRRSPSPSNRRHAAPPDRYLSPRQFTNDDKTRHQRSNSHTTSSGGYHSNNEKNGRKIHRTRSTEHYDHYPSSCSSSSSRYTPPSPINIPDDDSAIMMMDRRSRKNSYRSSSPLHRGESSYLLPLEQQQHMPRRVSSHQRLRSVSPNHQPPPLASTGRRATDPPNTNHHHRNRERAPIHRRRSMMLEDEEEETSHGQYYCEDDLYFSQQQKKKSARGGTSHPKQQQRRPSAAAYQPPPQQQSIPTTHHHHHNDALHDLCAFFHHLPRHVLANYLQDAGGDFYLAKDLCMEDIMANGI